MKHHERLFGNQIILLIFKFSEQPIGYLRGLEIYFCFLILNWKNLCTKRPRGEIIPNLIN